MSFYERNKAAVVAGAVVSVAAVAGAAYYLSLPASTPVVSKEEKPKKKKSKKKKKSTTPTVTEEVPTPEFNENEIDSMSAEEKEKLAVDLKTKGNELFKDKKYEAAIEFYSKALKCKEDHIFYGNRSACYSALGNFEKTIEDTTKALELDPKYTKCLFRRATAFENVGKFEDSLFDITALTIYGGMTDGSNEKMLERVLGKLSNKLDEEVYSKLPKELPSASSMSSFFGAFVKEDLDLNVEYPEGSGQKYLIEALKVMDADTQEGYEKADVLFNQSIAQFDKSTEGVDSALAAMAYEYAGAFAFLKTEPEQGRSLVEKAVQISPRPRQHVILGLIGADQGKFDIPTEEFGKAIAMNPNDPNIYYHYGQIHYLMGALTEAQKYFEKAKELNPENVYAHIQLACIVYRQGDFNKCEEIFKQAKATFPTSPEVPNYYGEILFDSKNMAGAVKQFDTAARLQLILPTFNIGALPLINKSVIYQQQGDIVNTINTLVEAVQLDPKSEVARMSLGQMLLQSGDVSRAVEMFEAAARLSRASEDRKHAISLLEASKMQLRVRDDPILSEEVKKLMSKAGVAM
ncbi:protein channel [Martiniozyma asiatica (nom. inval.)]|nr:protein channel [Martiniozyma asiatica]